MTHVPHDRLTPGLWYIRTLYEPYYTVVSITPFVIGPDAGKLGVWMIDQEGNSWPEDFAPDQFIRPVPQPFNWDEDMDSIDPYVGRR